MDKQVTKQTDESLGKLSRVIPLSDFQMYMPLVRCLAAREARKRGPGVLREDLVAAGACGLIDALCNHDGTLGTSFFAYASIRIRRAILEHVRKQDSASRRSRENAPDASATSVCFDLREKKRAA